MLLGLVLLPNPFAGSNWSALSCGTLWWKCRGNPRLAPPRPETRPTRLVQATPSRLIAGGSSILLVRHLTPSAFHTPPFQPACQQCADPQVLAFLVGAAFSGADHYLHGTSLTRTRRQARPNAQSHQPRAPRTSCGKGPWQRAILGTTSCSILRHFNQFVSNVQTHRSWPFW